MLDFISTLTDLIGTGIDYIVNTVTGLVKVLGLIPVGISFLWESIANLPPEINVFCYIAVTISLVFLILGR